MLDPIRMFLYELVLYVVAGLLILFIVAKAITRKYQPSTLQRPCAMETPGRDHIAAMAVLASAALAVKAITMIWPSLSFASLFS